MFGVVDPKNFSFMYAMGYLVDLQSIWFFEISVVYWHFLRLCYLQ
jgi:hypothetical protein